MDDIVESLAKNPWIIVIGVLLSILGLFGLPLSVFLHFRGKKERVPRYAVRNNNIIKGHKDKYPAVKVHFENYGEDIANLSVSKVIFWNYGKETIKKQDIVKPGIFMRIKNGFKIVDVAIVQFTTEENKFIITKSQDRASATITFEYIDQGEGVIFQVFHTGTSDQDLSITGKVMGAGEPVRMKVIPADHPNKGQALVLIFGPIVITLALFAMSQGDFAKDPLPKVEPIPIAGPVGYACLIVFFVLLYAGCWTAACLMFRRRMPKDLDKLFLEDV